MLKMRFALITFDDNTTMKATYSTFSDKELLSKARKDYGEYSKSIKVCTREGVVLNGNDSESL